MANYFLDTSALAKLYHQETGSDYMDRILEQTGSRSLISRLSIVELESVLAIKIRTGEIDQAALQIARRRFRADLARQRLFVAPPVHEGHFQNARKLLVQYGVSEALRTLDALQLAIALDLTAKGISPSLSLRTKGSAESRHWRDVPRSTLSSQVQSWPENLHRIPVQTEDDSGRAVHPLPVYRSFLHFLPLYPSHTPLM